MLLYLAIGVVAIVAGAVLIAPWRLDLHVQKAADSAQVRVRAHLRWMVFRWRVDKGVARVSRTKRSASTRTLGASPGRAFASMRRALATPGFLARTRRLIAALGRQARPRHVWMRGRVGLDDPSDTGVVIGMLYGLAPALPQLAGHVKIQADFSQPVFDVVAHARWSLRLMAVVWPMTTFLASPVVWRAMRAAMRVWR